MDVRLLIEPRHWSAIPGYIWATFFFVFGSAVGSFLNVCIYRIPRGLSIVWPPSRCPACQYRIPWYLNIPILSWLMLGGRCRNCGAPIAFRYIAVELITALLFVGIWFFYWDKSPCLVLAYCVLVSGLVVASFIDAEHYIIPDEITIGGMIVGFIMSGLIPELHEKAGAVEGFGLGIWGIVVGVGIAYSVLWLGRLVFGRYRVQIPPNTKVFFGDAGVWVGNRMIPYEEVFNSTRDVIRCHARRVELVDRCYWDIMVRLSPRALQIGDDRFNPEDVSFMELETDCLVFPREAMGWGDVKFLGAIGAFVGWKGVIFSIMWGSIIGGLVGMIMIITGRRGWGSQLPFGPYLAMGTVLWLFGGQTFWKLLIGG